MHRSAHQAALDQANLLATYLAETPTSSIDLHFVRRHLDALDTFVQAAKTDSVVVLWSDRARVDAEQDAHNLFRSL